jgi:hypothetical protein
MKVKLYKPVENTVRLRLIEVDDQLALVEVDEDGETIGGGYLCYINESGIQLLYGYDGKLPKKESYVTFWKG